MDCSGRGRSLVRIFRSDPCLPASRRRPGVGGCFEGLPAEFDVWEAPEGLVTGEEPRADPAGRGVSNRVRVRQLRTSDLQTHRLEQPSVLRVDGNRPEPCELSLGLVFPSVPENGEIQFDEIPDARSQLRGKIPSVPGTPPYHLDECIRVQEEPGRSYQPRRSSSFSFCGSTLQSRSEPNASSIPAWSISRTTSSPALSPSSFAISLGTTIPSEEPQRRTRACARATSPICYIQYITPSPTWAEAPRSSKGGLPKDSAIVVRDSRFEVDTGWTDWLSLESAAKVNMASPLCESSGWHECEFRS